MPELPEVETVVTELRKKLKDKRIKDVRILLPKIVAMGPLVVSNLRKTDGAQAIKFAKTLKGKKISGVTRRAKMIIIDLEGKLAILVHLKMTGQLIYLNQNELDKQIRLFNTEKSNLVRLPAKSTHVIFEFTDHSRLFYNDFRQFGYLKLVTDKELPEVPELQNYGPEPLEKTFTLSVLEKIMTKRPNMKLKQFLLDPTLIVGIGNIYSDEIAFVAKLKPTRLIKSINSESKKLLFKAIQKVLADAVKKGGSSVGDFVHPDGTWGTYGKVHKVYGRSKKGCFICGSIIKSMKFNGRTGSFCPKCQK